ncbi:MAG: M48 family metallopeptidase [Ignavibacteriaceae bacterium]
MNSKKYNNIKLILGITEAILTFIVLFLFVSTGLSYSLVEIIEKLVSGKYLILIAFTAAVGVAFSIIFAPFGFYTGYYLEHKYKLSNQSFNKWLLEKLKGFAVSSVIGLPVLIIFYFLLNEFGNLWWLPFAVVLFLVSVILARLVPVLILPIFYRITPVSDEDLKFRIKSISEEAGLKVENVYQFDMSKKTKKANALFTGLGKTKRIILGDTLLDNFTPEQIETVIAHEAGHYKHKHILKNIIIGTVSSFVTLFVISLLYKISLQWFGFSSITEIAALPLLILWIMLVTLIQTPLSNILSRKFEYEADHYAVAVTGKADTFVSALEKLNEQNLGDADPHPFIEWFFYSHPSIKNRIKSIMKSGASGYSGFSDFAAGKV